MFFAETSLHSSISLRLENEKRQFSAVYYDAGRKQHLSSSLGVDKLFIFPLPPVSSGACFSPSLPAIKGKRPFGEELTRARLLFLPPPLLIRDLFPLLLLLCSRGREKGKEAGGSVIAIKSTRGKKDSGRGQRDGGEGESHSKKCLFWRGLSFPSTLCAWLDDDDDDALSERVATG